ncbi:MAG: mannose-6-phosphate isomerase, class I [Treponema sp.]|jgi:mannose-6-phosphate isomerase|nr:mannose-6-phosphate isomerase, class I [Treponema sp.]
MARLFKLENKIKHYDWGSPEWIPRLLERENTDGSPWAELWMGVHPEGPSETRYNDESIALPGLINRDPSLYLGEGAARAFGSLPFLFKLLAAAKPLSIQVHPNLEQAALGWERENRAGIALGAPNRNYKDQNHKPEILCALSPFKALCGFREPEQIIKRLEALAFPSLAPLIEALASGGSSPGGLKDFLKGLLTLPRAARDGLTRHIIEQSGGLEKTHPAYAEEWEYAAYFAGLYPGDPSALAPLYLNLISLAPGQAIFLPAGILHAYIYGFGVELMANSDNVLRGGLTPKYIDVDELLNILEFAPRSPEILLPREIQPSFFTYRTPCREFSLSMMTGTGGRTIFPEAGPLILLLTQGELSIDSGEGEGLVLRKGESAFIAARPRGEDLVFSGTYTLYAAGIGSAGSGAAGDGAVSP